MVQFIINLGYVDETVDEKTDIPSSFEDFDLKLRNFRQTDPDVWRALDGRPRYDRVQVDYFNSLR